MKIDNVFESLVYEYLGSTGLKMLDFGVNLIIALLILLIGFRVVHLVLKIIKHMMIKSNMDITLRTFLISFLKVALRILVVFLAIGRIGVGASSIIALLGSAGVALGLSLQGSLSNIAGGVILLTMKPFTVGDYILEDSSEKEGTVQAIGIMYTKLLSLEHKTLLVPNGNLANSTITNFTAEGPRRVKILIGIGYGEDIKKAKDVLEKVVLDEQDRLPEQGYQIFLDEFQDSSICMGIHYWVKPENYWQSKWRVQEAVKNGFDENGITIPFNQLDVTLVNNS
jgi:small conductance mechanosensitive channel